MVYYRIAPTKKIRKQFMKSLTVVNTEDDIKKFNAILSKKKQNSPFKKNPFRFPPLFFICFVNHLKINGFCRSLTDSFVIFR